MNQKFSLIFISFFLSICASAQVVTIESGQKGLGPLINSRFYERFPVLYPDGSKIFFTRSGDPQNTSGSTDNGDIWISELLPDSTWSQSRRTDSSLNNGELNAVTGFLSTGNIMILTNQYKQRGSKDSGFSLSTQTDDTWKNPVNVDIPYFKSQSDFKSASISPDGNVMLFSVMSFGSYGVEDLYFTRLKPDGSWSDLRNLGPQINTRFQDMHPFIAPDNKTIYFASNGHGGYGGLDIFWSQRLDDTWRNWTTPQNLGPKVNTEGSESSFSFLPDQPWAILVSTQNSDGYGDLKRVEISFPDEFVAKVDTAENVLITKIANDSVIAAKSTPEPRKSLNFKGFIYDAKSKAAIKGAITAISEFDSLNIMATQLEGFSVQLEDADYQLVISSQDYLEYDTALSVTSGTTIERDFFLQPLEVGNTITLRHVLFERGTTTLISGSEQDLEAVYHMLRDNPTIEIEVAGHTDNQGSFDLNVKLSQERVDKVIDFLINKGIRKKRLSGKGWGPMKPIASNANEETRKLNRRVEFTIVKK